MTTNNAINAPFPFALNIGGTAANLTASNGGIIYSTASAMAILSGTATALQMLQSGASSAPAWSTTTWPATTTANQILYSSSTSVIDQITTANSAVLVTSNAGVPSFSGTMTNGQLIIGSTTATPTAATITAGANITVTNGAGSITIASTGGAGATWINQTGTSVTMAVNSNYLANASSLVTLTLPSTAAQGSMFQVAGINTGGWKIAQAASQQINYGNVTTTSGTGGSLASSNEFDVVSLVCTAANTQFQVINSVGNLTYV